MKVIVAGMPKTGTKSMNHALTALGFKVYDVIENTFYYGEDFLKIVTQGWSTEDFRRMYEDIDAVVDVPACFFWDEIHKAFPDAKIVLTLRDNEDVWVRSLAKQLENNESSIAIKFLERFSLTNKRKTKFFKALFPMALGFHPAASMFGGRKADEFNHEMLKRIYRAHNAYVLHSAPKDKLLVYKCSEGWEPLCDFLGVPVPDEPFPHKNKNAALTRDILDHPLVKQSMREGILAAGLMITATVATGLAIYKYGVTGIVTGLYHCVEMPLRKLYST